jgi:hypothetical protein
MAPHPIPETCTYKEIKLRRVAKTLTLGTWVVYYLVLRAFENLVAVTNIFVLYISFHLQLYKTKTPNPNV